MGDTVKELIKIYKALGGTENTAYIRTIPQALALIAIQISTGGLCVLPEVSVADNGDILRVVAGKWAKAEAELPAVSADDNGDILRVAEGSWAKADAELPAVSATDNGSVLKVIEGAWGVGEDATE